MDTSEKTPTTYYTPRQVAFMLRVDAYTVRKWIKTGILAAEAIQEGRRHRWSISQQAINTLRGNKTP